MKKEKYPKRYDGCRIKRKDLPRYNIHIGDRVEASVNCQEEDEEGNEYFTENSLKPGKYEGIYIGTVRFLTPDMPIFWIPDLNQAICGFECWWKKKEGTA